MLTMGFLALLAFSLSWFVGRRFFSARHGRWLLLSPTVLFVAYPLERFLTHRLVQWLYQGNFPALSDRLLSARRHLPLAHYLSRADAMLNTLLIIVAAFWLLAALVLWARKANLLRMHWWRSPWARTTMALIGLVFGLFVGYNLWLDWQFRQPHPVFYTDCRKVWGHRGHPQPPEVIENTIPSYRLAFDLGAPGVEMDVRYDPERREYYIGRYDQSDPPPDQRLTLSEVFSAVGDRGYFWLDVKTIHYLTPEQARQAARDMAALLDQFGLRQRAIIESDTPENLQYFAQLGLHTSYWIFNVDSSVFPRYPWTLWWALVKIKRNYIKGGFSAISLDVRFYTPMVAWMLRGARIHLFTINNPTALRRWVSRPEVKVILTDSAAYDITACP